MIVLENMKQTKFVDGRQAESLLVIVRVQQILIQNINMDEKKENKIRCEVKAALENMYMFGGMSRPDPKYLN